MTDITPTPATREAQEYAFRELKKKPFIAWPTVLLMLACHSAIAASWYFVLQGHMALWVGCLINIIAMYYLFSPIHDALHRAVSNKEWLNELIMFIILLPMVPLSSGRFLRIMHMQHHRFTNDPEKDPDHLVSHKVSNALWLWFFWDVHYMIHYFRNRDDMPKMGNYMLVDLMLPWFVTIALLATVPMEAVFLWLVPVRCMAWLVCAVFMWLPHFPHDVIQADKPFHATHMREGWSWLLTPLMAYQNYHLVHHLYPTVPFYRYKKVWDAKKDIHEASGPSVVPAFGLMPERIPPAQADAAQG